MSGTTSKRVAAIGAMQPVSKPTARTTSRASQVPVARRKQEIRLEQGEQQEVGEEEPNGDGEEYEEESADSEQAGLQEQLRLALQAMHTQHQQIAELQARLGAQEQTRGGDGTRRPVSTQAKGNTGLEAPRRAAVQPNRLRGSEAAKPGVLDDWLFDLNALLAQLNLADAPLADKLRIAAENWDRATQAWWEGCDQLAQGSDRPITTWEQFVAAIRANYVPVADADVAQQELFALRMTASESMERYMSRAAALSDRVPQTRVPSTVVADLAAKGVDGSRFPIALTQYRMRLMEQRTEHAGEGFSFAATRQLLTSLAAAEPSQWGPMTGAPRSAPPRKTGDGGSATSSRGNTMNRAGTDKQVRINALRRELQQLEQRAPSSGDEEVGGSVVQAAAVDKRREGMRDMRTCFACGQTGHIKRQCPQRNANEQDARPEGTPPRPTKY